MAPATVADGATLSHPSKHGALEFNAPHVVDQLIASATGADRRKFPSPEMLRSAASLIPGVPAITRSGRTWIESRGEVDGQTILAGLADADVLQDSPLPEGPQWYVSVSPGRVRVWTRDDARDDRRQTRERDSRTKQVDALTTFFEFDEYGELVDCVPPERASTREVTAWSAKSRVNMIGSFADLDYTPMFSDALRAPAMITLTYPRCWQTVAPSGKAAKRHLKAWRKRWEREYGEKVLCIWKMEFQGRDQYVWRDGQRVLNWCDCETCAPLEDGRAPHFHLLVTIPRERILRDGRGRVLRDEHGQALTERITRDDFRAWVSRSWADVVDHPDPAEYAAHLGAGTRVDTHEGARAADPRRVAVYFAKHGGAKAKEYQHCVPAAWSQPGEGPGRFWGYWGLEKAVVTVAVTPGVGVAAGRVVRRHSRAQGVTRLTSRRRYRGGRVVSAYPEVIGLAGAQLVAAHTLTHRPCRTRAVRAQQGRGWLMVNDGAAFGAYLARALQDAIDQRLADVVLNPSDPLVRAFRLPPSPRRDALLARFSGAVPQNAKY
jgi:hypothetical protein